MKTVLVVTCFLLISSFNMEQSNAQGACPGPNCRSASAAAAATKAADDKKKAQYDAAKAAKISETKNNQSGSNNNGSNSAPSTPNKSNKEPSVFIRKKCEIGFLTTCTSNPSLGIRG